MKRMRIAQAAVLLLVASVCFYFGREIPFAEQWVVYDSLRDVAAIVFGIMGAWIAIIYPETLTQSFREQHSTRNVAAPLRRLLEPMVYAGLVIAAVLFIGVLAPIAKRVEGMTAHTDLLRGLSFSLIALLTLLLLWSLALALLPGEDLTTRVERNERRNKLIEGYRKQHQRADDQD